MDAQPDIRKISIAFSDSSKALAIASQEIDLVTNLPAFDNGQRVFDAIDRLNSKIDNLTTQVSTLTTQVSTLTTQVSTLATQVNDKFDSLELRLSVDSLNQTARIYNSRIFNRETPLRIFYNQRNMEVEGFPSDSASLMRLPAATLTRLLDTFQLPTDGNLETKKKRFREFIGLVADA